jgi:glycerol-3-phosphate acyltransferase PlsY
LRGVDVRFAGSGNVGAANVLRTTGAWRGVVVMALDVAKGISAVTLAQALAGGAATIALSGAAAVVGHIYPVWLRFHGGKGVAVAAGVFTILTPAAAAGAATIFLIIAWVTRYVSLASISATLALPPMAWMFGAPGPVVFVSAGTAVLILFRHRSNWHRLRMGTERRMGGRA